MKPNLSIGVDGFNLALPKGTGVATYSIALSRALRSLGHHINLLYGLPIPKNLSPDLMEVLFFDMLGADLYPRRPKFPKVSWWIETFNHFYGHKPEEIFISGRVVLKEHATRLPEYDKVYNIPSLFRAAQGFFKTTGCFLTVNMRNPPDIMHWTYPLPLKVRGSKNIYTIHDIVPLQLPHTTLDDKKLYFNLLTKIVRQSDGICTVSEASKKAIIDMFPAAEGHVYNTYQSHLLDEYCIGDDYLITNSELHRLFSLKSDEYFLFFGQLEPKKNIGRIIKSFLLSNTHRKLVIVGSNAWKEEDELRFLGKGMEDGRIMQIQYVERGILYSLIKHARALIFPSIAEGFGLPVLESLVLETPVLTSREAPLREVAGDVAVLVDPYDINDIKEGIEFLDSNDELCSFLRKKSKEQAEKFSPSHYAENLSNFYRKVLV
ncbi:glycosyltransferase family 4 protein [Bombella apis]|uniref:glycosyltransferase family 4 protein n=1 Tax=Bombella apis TaxID=1785988 RepID=UPI0024A7E0C7|nr:glycosyltransferase family 1 protein [Bombella apis]